MYLNDYQKEILQALAEDMPIKEIAAHYKQPYHSVNKTIELMRKKHGCKTTLSLVLLGLLSEQIEWPEQYALRKTA